jgi:hypothetical protein
LLATEKKLETVSKTHEEYKYKMDQVYNQEALLKEVLGLLKHEKDQQNLRIFQLEQNLKEKDDHLVSLQS